jgi:ketosteroid isomerase-like protein
VTGEAVSVIERFNELMERGEVSLDLIDPDVVIVDHDIPDAGDYHGHEGLRKWLEDDWGSAWESYALEPGFVEDGGDVVLSVFTIVARGKGSGVETRRRNATVNTVKDGRVTRIDYYTTEEEARAAAAFHRPRSAERRCRS